LRRKWRNLALFEGFPEAKLRLQSRVEIPASLASGGNDLAQ
jgi:hypothetical protein